jgi:hypothetical protein
MPLSAMARSARTSSSTAPLAATSMSPPNLPPNPYRQPSNHPRPANHPRPPSRRQPPNPRLPPTSVGAALVKLKNLGNGIACPDNKAVAAVTAYNSDSAEEQFAVGSDCRVYHRWQMGADGQFSRWSSLGGCAPGHQGLAVGMNGDGELVAFVISPDHTVRYNSQSKPGLGPWVGWTSIGGNVSTGLRVVSARNGSSPIQVFANDKSGGLWENDQTQGKGDCCWSGWRKVQPPFHGAN